MTFTNHCYTALLLATFSIATAQAQTAYSMHSLEKGETLSTLAKSYHTTVGDIMRLNGMHAQSQLIPGEKIKIPAGGSVAPVAKAATPTVTAPVASANAVAKTHTVATGETLYRISKMYNVPVEKLQAWNNISDGGVKLGQTLVVSEGSAPQSSAVSKPEAKAVTTSQSAQTPVVQTEVTAQTPTIKQTPSLESKPVVQQPAPNSNPNTAQLTKVPSENSVPATVDNNQFASNEVAVNNAPKEGFFTPLYGKEAGRQSEQVKNGTAMTFKSASGWADKKYYILMNDAPTGSIVKIKNGKNELYAKVLWNLGEMKENDGLSFRISTATAAALGISDQKFDLRVSYYE